MSARSSIASVRRTVCDVGEIAFRLLGLKLGRWCDGVADWFAERAR